MTIKITEREHRNIFQLLQKELEDESLAFYMGAYISDEYAKNSIIASYKEINHCNTACCIAGLIPKVAPKFANYYLQTDNTRYNFNSMSTALLSDLEEEIKDTVWEYLFSSGYPSDKQAAIKRIQSVLDGIGYYGMWLHMYLEGIKH